MCDYTQVEYQCGHLRYVVKSVVQEIPPKSSLTSRANRAWCIKYQATQKRCPANVVAMYVQKRNVYMGAKTFTESTGLAKSVVRAFHTL